MKYSITIKNEDCLFTKQHFQTDQQIYKGLDKFSWNTLPENTGTIQSAIKEERKVVMKKKNISERNELNNYSFIYRLVY